MVKRDRLLALSIWLPKILIMLGFMIFFVILWRFFSAWPSLDFVTKGATALGIVFSLSAVLSGVRLVRREEYLRQWKHVETLRMESPKAFPCQVQPEISQKALILPIILSTRLSAVVYFGFLIFWLLVVSIFLVLPEAFLNTVTSRGTFPITFLALLALGGIIIGLTGTLMYQRIEATEQALTVQRGLKRQKLLWEQAKLFASIRILGGGDTPAQYKISGEHKLLRLTTAYPPCYGFVTRPQGKEPYERLLNDLLTYIHARTGLPLLDLH